MYVLDFSGVVGVQRVLGYLEGRSEAAEFTKPEYWPFESASLPGYYSLEKQIKFIFCMFGTMLLTSFVSKIRVMFALS